MRRTTSQPPLARRDRAGAHVQRGSHLHALRRPVRALAQAIADGSIDARRDPEVEADRVLALTGLTPLLDLGVIAPAGALAAVDKHLEELFSE